VCAVMAEPFGVPAGRVSSDVPGVIPGGPRPLPAVQESTAAEADKADAAVAQAIDKAETDGESADEPAKDDAKPTAVPIGEGEELIELSDEDKAAVPSRSDDQGS